MKSIFTLSLCLLSWTISMAQTTLTFTPSKDNTIYELSNTSSNGAGSSIYIGNDVSNRKRRCLIQFDLSSIPANATITNVTLKLTVNRTIDPTSRTHKLHKLSVNWGEGSSTGTGAGGAATANDATWTDRLYGVSTWSSVGGDFNTTISSSTTFGGTGSFATFPSTTQLITDVQSWVGSPSSNYGWIVIGDESTSQTARGFDSRESPTTANRPTLSITFNTSLPVELIDFTANTEGSKNRLSWATAYEINSKAFEIERSSDGTDFTTIGVVKAANIPNRYQFLDNQPLTNSYYRLLQIDNDGREDFSKIITISNKGAKTRLKIYPTIVSNILNVVTTDSGAYQIFNLLGQQVLGGEIIQQLDVSSLTQGIYIFRVGKEQLRFIKQF